MYKLAVFCALVALNIAVAPAQTSAPPMHLTICLYFSPTCPHCHPVRALIKGIRARHSQVSSVEYNLAEPSNVEKMAAAYQQYAVPEDEWGGTIALFVGDQWWSDGDKILKQLVPAVDDLIAHPQRWAPPPPAATTPPADASTRPLPSDPSALRRVFNNFGIVTVAGAGLLDGINPCAFATLVFLISYLTYSKRSPKEVLATGLLFGAGVFLAYLAIGLGLFRALQMTSGLSTVSRLLYPIMAGGTFILSCYSFRDYVLARRGAHREMTLQLPGRLKRLSHQAIRNLGRPGVFLGIAFVIGAAVSVLELFCTGQIYLPTLMYMWSTSHDQTRVLLLLLLYVLMFTLPILIVAVLAYTGVQSRAIAGLAEKHVAPVKLATAAFFLVLTVFLLAVSMGHL